MKKIKTIILFLAFVFSVAAQSAICVSPKYETTPAIDFESNGDGSIKHKKTNLTWKVCSEGQSFNSDACDGQIKYYSWQETLILPNTVNHGDGYLGYKNWRLPTNAELSSITEYKCGKANLNAKLFPSIETNIYWATHPMKNEDDKKWGILTVNGSPKGRYFYINTRVRLVRDAE